MIAFCIFRENFGLDYYIKLNLNGFDLRQKNDRFSPFTKVARIGRRLQSYPARF
jgi:hypothetical protein